MPEAPRGGIYALDGVSPSIAEDVFVAPGAQIIGDVEIGAGASIWFNVVIRGDGEPIRIGARTNIQDGTIIHTDPGYPCTIGEGVTIGHGAIVHGASVGDGALIGMGAVVLTGAMVGNKTVISAGAVVVEGASIPDGTVAMGMPARERRSASSEELARFSGGAAHYVENGQRFRSGLSAVGAASDDD